VQVQLGQRLAGPGGAPGAVAPAVRGTFIRGIDFRWIVDCDAKVGLDSDPELQCKWSSCGTENTPFHK